MAHVDDFVDKISTTNPVIKLNVGGTRWDTFKSTLLKSGFFRALFSGKFADSKQEDGCYFLDSDGEIFKYLLNFLRRGYVSIPAERVQDVKQEAGFYQIDIDFSRVSEQLIPSQVLFQMEMQYKKRFNGYSTHNGASGLCCDGNQFDIKQEH